MKTLVVYATKYGCTKECAESLKKYLQGETVVISASNNKYNLNEFDAVIVGGSVYMGKIRKEFTRFCQRNKKVLLQKRLGLFACCYTPKDTEGFFESIFSQDLLHHATYTTTVGGRMDYDKMNFAYRKLFQSLKKIEGFQEGFTEPEIDTEEIKRLADNIENCSIGSEKSATT